MVIAIDGYSSCGKSTLAKDLAKALGYIFIDSGAMYRAVALYSIQNSINVEDLESFNLDLIKIEFIPLNNQLYIHLNGNDVTSLIRSMEVSNIVSEVASISPVRKYLVKLQQEMGKTGGIVMDGRDIGSVVFPNAQFKFFVTASLEVRAHRRHNELIGKGISVEHEDIVKNLMHRDHIDSTRTDSPLTQLPDAIIIDTTHHTRVSQLREVLQIVTKS